MDNEEFETKKDIEIIIPLEAENKAEKFIENDDAKDHIKAIDEIEKYVKMTDDTKEHMKSHRKSIDYIFVSQYMYDIDNKEYDPTLDAYVATFSKNNNLIIRWRINVEKGEQPHNNVYFQYDQLKEIDKIESFILCKKILVLFTKGNDRNHLLEICPIGHLDIQLDIQLDICPIVQLFFILYDLDNMDIVQLDLDIGPIVQ
ncbi:hypothetical protein GLOIN_2v1576396 [Rhizophagus clarus]|uniref:Uncharacterized protein n=1 Tax=Rhizophagus clarus TaxID=94130 RepID=A0A8H3MCU3_9GLOM|nr:hypothetical protein GLOIN_2v1576396 [Rhizophagus clarus]